MKENSTSKAVGVILGIIGAVVAVGAAIYVVVTWGDKIVAWVRKLFAPKTVHICCNGDFVEDEEEEQVPAEETDFAE